MSRLLLQIVISATALLLATADVQKKVVNTAWWPPGTEKKGESVGVISHGFVFMTGMMEHKATLDGSMHAELSDIYDIAHAAGSSLEYLVDCLLNAPIGSASKVKAAFLAALPKNVTPALTVVELLGEYGSYFQTSATCIASLPPTSAEYPRRELQVAGARGVAAHGLLHVEAMGNASGSLQAIARLIRAAGGSGIDDLSDCTAFVRDIGDARAIRAEIFKECTNYPPTLTLVRAGLEDAHSSLSLRCVAAVPAGPQVQTLARRRLDMVKVAGQYAFVSGQYGFASNGSDAFTAIGSRLKQVDLSLSDVVNCLFFLRNHTQVFDFFSGFFEAFNKDHPPPPARDELEAASDCANCSIVAKCIAAFPIKHVKQKSSLIGNVMVV